MSRKTSFFRIVALLLVVILVCPTSVCAVEPRASNYLDSYSAYTYAAGSGKIQVWFDVTADNYMDDIGSLSIELYSCATNSSNDSDWSFVMSWNNGNTSSILGHDKIYYSSHVDYSGATVGRYYKAYICIYAGNDEGGDTRYFWTNSVKAT